MVALTRTSRVKPWTPDWRRERETVGKTREAATSENMLYLWCPWIPKMSPRQNKLCDRPFTTLKCPQSPKIWVNERTTKESIWAYLFSRSSVAGDSSSWSWSDDSSSKSDKCSANIAFYVFSQTPVASANISPIGACYMSTCDWWKTLRRPPDLLK